LRFISTARCNAEKRVISSPRSGFNLRVCSVAVGALIVRRVDDDPINAFQFLSENNIPGLEEFLASNPETLADKNKAGRSLLFQAVAENKLQAVEVLLAAGADALEADDPENPPLLLSLTKPDLFQVLLESIEQIEPHDPQFKKLLLQAVKMELIEQVHAMLESGVNPDVFDEKLSSALICATEQKSYTIMQDLLTQWLLNGYDQH